MFIVLLGTAGSGKTTLVTEFSEWVLQELGLTVGVANLDPGCESLPYSSDFDVRKFVTMVDLMKREGLGPNGAMVRAVEHMEKVLYKLFEGLQRRDLWLIDTPGQNEIFVFRKVGPKVIESLNNVAPTIGVYLIDSELAESASGLVSSFSQALAVKLRLNIPLVMILSKADLLMEDTACMFEDLKFLEKKVIDEQVGSLTDMTLGLIQLFKQLSTAQRVVKISTRTKEGFPELYDVIHESMCECGDLT
jgi:GTPase SAR1 family protein